MIECYEISVPVYMCEGLLDAMINFYTPFTEICAD